MDGACEQTRNFSEKWEQKCYLYFESEAVKISGTSNEERMLGKRNRNETANNLPNIIIENK